jgi:hypothetical protein
MTQERWLAERATMIDVSPEQTTSSRRPDQRLFFDR